MKKICGVAPAMTTPFDENDRVDVKGLEAQVDFNIEKGVTALYPLGTTGEMYLQTAEERKLVAKRCV